MRLTNKLHPASQKMAALKKQADPYELNEGQGHPDPYDKGLEVYQKDKPHSEGTSGWGEDVFEENLWKDDDKRNDIGLPMPGKYAKAKAEAVKNVAAKINKQAALEKHALNCYKLASLMYPEAYDAFLQESAAELMDLSPSNVEAQLERHFAYDHFATEMLNAESEDKMEDKKEEKAEAAAKKEEEKEEKEEKAEAKKEKEEAKTAKSFKASKEKEDSKEDKAEDKKEKEAKKEAATATKLDQLLNSIQKKIQASTQENTDLDRKVAELEKSLADLEELNSKKAVKLALEDSLTNLEKKIAQLENKFVRLANPVETVEPKKEDKTLSAEMEDLDAMQKEIESLEKEMAAMTEEAPEEDKEAESMYMQNAPKAESMEDDSEEKMEAKSKKEKEDVEDMPVDEEPSEEEVPMEDSETEDEKESGDLMHSGYGAAGMNAVDFTASEDNFGISFTDDITEADADASLGPMVKMFGESTVAAALASLAGPLPVQDFESVQKVAKVSQKPTVTNMHKAVSQAPQTKPVSVAGNKTASSNTQAAPKRGIQKLPTNLVKQASAKQAPIPLSALWDHPGDVSEYFSTKRY